MKAARMVRAASEDSTMAGPHYVTIDVHARRDKTGAWLYYVKGEWIPQDAFAAILAREAGVMAASEPEPCYF